MSYENPRIQLNMSVQDVVIEMSEGNPGAVNVLLSILTNNESIDPEDIFRGLGPILGLDTADIYGSEIYILFKYVAKGNIVDMLGLIRSVQLGFASDSELKEMIANEAAPEGRVAELLAQVRGRLPKFKQDSTV